MGVYFVSEKWLHTIVELAGIFIMGLTFSWYLSGRITTLEVKVDLLMNGQIRTAGYGK
jgi:hypothetical protein